MAELTITVRRLPGSAGLGVRVRLTNGTSLGLTDYPKSSYVSDHRRRGGPGAGQTRWPPSKRPDLTGIPDQRTAARAVRNRRKFHWHKMLRLMLVPFVRLTSDADALPHEHEAEHRRLVGRLFPGLALADDPEARVRVRRERPARDPVVG
jgi:hypothetical protein